MIRSFLTKFLLGNPADDRQPIISPLQKRVRNLKAIWNNELHYDMGIEKMFRLFLALSQFLFPGTYIKHCFGRKSIARQDLAVDAYVLLKMLFPFFILKWQLQEFWPCYILVLWFMAETLLYVPTLIFASDIFSRPRSYRRSMLLLFFNYLEVILDFAVLYTAGHHLNRPFEHWVDPAYFSFITSATIGFGDYHPVTPWGKILVSAQSIIFLLFVVLFLNFFANKVESKGYFDHDNKS